MHATLKRLAVSLWFAIVTNHSVFESIPEMACRHSIDIVVGDMQPLWVWEN
jgi:hypothetical protein